jgi:hypothetical protein
MGRMNRFWIIMLSILFLNACQSNISNQIKGQSSAKEAPTPLRNGIDKSSSLIEGSIGIITTTDKYKFGDTILVFNEQKQSFTSIVITYEYQVLKLKCLMITNDFYKVQINDSVSGYLVKSNPLIKFQTWEEHVLSVFSVGFDEKINPLRENPSIKASKVNYSQNEFYLPHKIQGDWLEVKWGSEGNWQYGWIMWEKDGKLLIELFYFA